MKYQKNKKIFKIEDYKRTLFNAINRKSVLDIRKITEKIEKKDIALFLKELPANKRFFFIRSLKTVAAAEVFNLLDDDTVEKTIESLNNFETQKIISFLYSDDIVELIEDLPPELVNKILKSCSQEQRMNINHILNYPEDTVGSEMNVEFIKLKETSKISDIIETIYKKFNEKIPEENKYFYVVDDLERLIGYVSIFDLIWWQKSKQNKTIKDLIKKDVIFINALDSKEEVVVLFKKYEINELPVVDMNQRLIGVINNEQYFQIMEDVEIEDVNKQVGVTKSGFKKYSELNIFEMFKSRIFWLGITFFISTISQIILKFIISHDDNGTSKNFEFIKEILPYLPFILTIVGNIALQSTAMIIKNITLNEVKKGSYLISFWKEFKVSSLILIVIILLNIPRVLFIDYLIFGQTKILEEINDIKYWIILGVITLIIVFSLLFSVFLSTGLPILASRFNKDPSLMSSPLITTLIDLIATFVAIFLGYFLLVQI